MLQVCRIFLLLLITVAGFTNCMAQPQKFSFSRPKMGSPFTMILVHSDSLHAAAVAENCFSLVDSLAAIFTDYADSSELNRLCARAGDPAGFVCSPALFDILQLSAGAWQKTGGKFDISLGPLTHLWRRARKTGQWPAADSVAAARARCGFQHVQLFAAESRAVLDLPGMQLDLGGIAQGYIAGKVLQRSRDLGIQSALVDVSGDIATSAAPPGAAGWKIAVNVPEEAAMLLPGTLLISNCSVTTSGDLYQFMLHEGKRYSHIIDPATGYGTTHPRNTTIISTDCVAADWMTKAGALLPFRKAKKLANAMGAGILVTENRNGKIRKWSNRNFRAQWK